MQYGYIYVFEIQLSNKGIKNVVRPNGKLELQKGVFPTGNTNNSAFRHDMNAISMAISTPV